MNLQFFLEKLNSSEEYKKFIKENPDAFLCSGFFVIDKTGKEGNKQHFDYYVPKIKKMFSFKMEPEIEKVPIEMFGTQECTPKNIQNDISTKGSEIPEKILADYDFDFQDIEKKIIREIEKKGIKTKIQKILLSLQKLDSKDFLVGTIFISSLGMIKINISLPEQEIVKFEKKSFFDMVKIIKKKK